MNSKIRGLLLAMICAALAVGVAACGSDSDSTATSGGETSAEGGETSAEGGESSSFTYGYSVPTGQNPWISAIASAAMEKADAGGGEGELADSQLDPATAVAQINRFAVQGDEVIVVGPAQVPEAIQGSLTKAAGEGKKILALEWSFGSDPSEPPEAPVQGQANIDRVLLGEEIADTINAANPQGAKVVYVGLPFPVNAVDLVQSSMEEALGKSKVIANLDNPTDNAQGALGPLNGALAANPDTNAIVTYNGPSALAAVQAVNQAGLTGKVNIYNMQLDSPTAKAIEEGKVAAGWDINPIELGDALGELMAAAGSGAPEAEWAKTVVIDPVMYDEETIGTWEDWAS